VSRHIGTVDAEMSGHWAPVSICLITDSSALVPKCHGPNCLGSEVYVHRPFDYNRPWAEKWGAAVPLSLGEAGSPSIAMSPGPRPASRPSGILIYPTLWPQYTNDTRQTHRQAKTPFTRCNLLWNRLSNRLTTGCIV